jgi:hypothetical protein
MRQQNTTASMDDQMLRKTYTLLLTDGDAGRQSVSTEPQKRHHAELSNILASRTANLKQFTQLGRTGCDCEPGIGCQRRGPGVLRALVTRSGKSVPSPSAPLQMLKKSNRCVCTTWAMS